MKFTIPLRTKSAPNLREHWAAKARRVKAERATTRLEWICLRIDWDRPRLPVVVTLSRVAPRTLDDDNLRSCLKAMRNEVAALLEVNDSDPRVTWAYAQERGKPREYAVRVEIEALGGLLLKPYFRRPGSAPGTCEHGTRMAEVCGQCMVGVEPTAGGGGR